MTIFRVRALGQWIFSDPKAFWAAIGAPIIAMGVAWRLPGNEEWRVRVAGFTLTLFGVMLVVRGILETQKQFGRPTYRARVAAWANRFPDIFRSRHVIVATSTGSLGLSGSASATVRRGLGDGSTEARLRALEENLRRVDERITETEQQFQKNLRQLEEALSQEQREREQRDAAQDKRLEEYSLGSLDDELAGVVWLIAGQLFSSFPVEIATWFH